MTWDDTEFLLTLTFFVVFAMGLFFGYCWGASDTMEMEGEDDEGP